MTKSAFSLEKREDGIAILSMDVVDKTMNVLKAEFGEQVSEVLDDIEKDDQIKGVVIISGKDNSFVAGADVTMLDSLQTAAEVEAVSKAGHQVFNRIENFKKPIIAAINGPALGGGLELAMACHERICSDSKSTVLGLPEVQLGLLPGGGGTQRLPKLVGLQLALDMMLTGKQLNAKKAMKAGIVDEVVPKSILLDAAIEMSKKGKPASKKNKLSGINKFLEGTSAGRKIVYSQATKMVAKKTQGNYPAPEKIIDCIRTGIEQGSEKGHEVEARHFAELCMTPVSAELRNIFFVTTEMKKEHGTTVAPVKVNKAAILGGGLMGGGIAYVTAIKGKIPARIKDIAHQGIANALKYSYDMLNKRVKRKQMTPIALKKQLSLLSGTIDYSGFHDVDIVVEAVFEDLELKKKMVADVEANCRENTIFATNTSSIPITKIAEGAQRPENVIGLHYFSPVEKMPLAEIITHEKTSDQTISTTVEFAKRQGKTPIVVKDGAGFYVNRMLVPYMNEAANVVLEGVAVEELDKMFVKWGLPVGPVTLLDEVGIDIGAKVAKILENELGDRIIAPSAFSKLIDDGRLGRKNEKGFYIYGKAAKKGKKQVDETVYQTLGITPGTTVDSKKTVERCIMAMLNEAAMCLEEGIIRSARDGDIGAIFGIGFPPFLGGPFRYMDYLGLDYVVNSLEKLKKQYGDKYSPAASLLAMAEKGERFYK